jgi:hypothetical protein
MGNLLRIANTEETRRYYTDDEQDFIDLRAQLTKKQANNLLRFAPRKEDDLDGGLRFISKAFDDLIVGWSLVDEKGKMVEPTVAVYESLDASGASWIDRKVGEHLRVLLGVEAEQAEGKLENLPQTPSKELDMSNSA